MELFEFPLDFQHLQLQFEVQCAKDRSPFPVQIVTSPDLLTNMDEESFHLRNLWGLSSMTC